MMDNFKYFINLLCNYPCCFDQISNDNQSHVLNYCLLLDRNNSKHKLCKGKVEQCIKTRLHTNAKPPNYPTSRNWCTDHWNNIGKFTFKYTVYSIKQKSLFLDIILVLFIWCFCNCYWKKYIFLICNCNTNALLTTGICYKTYPTKYLQ